MAALEERASPSLLKKREACEKGWLAVVEAIDGFLEFTGNKEELLAAGLASTIPMTR